MFSALFSFLGGSAFRLIFGEVSSFFTKRQEHKYELERMEIQERLDAANHSRNLESIRLQADMGIKVVQVQAEADLTKIEMGAWAGLVDSTTKMTGIKFLDIWNGCIRPMLATLAILAVLMQIHENGWVLSDWDKELIGAILGIYVADRQLAKRGK